MAERVKAWLQSWESALQERDINAAVELFQEDECFWRDLVAFTWNLYSAESREEIAAMLAATLEESQPSGWELDGEVEETPDNPHLLQAFIKFQTKNARGKGHLKLVGDKCWCLLTTMQELKGHEEKAGLHREIGVEHGVIKGRKTWAERRREEIEGMEPYCLIVGGGQAGVALGTRLRRLGVPTLIVEKNERIGDTWRKRYRTLCLHSPVWYTHFPYMPFPDDWPLYAPKDRVGDWVEAYAQAMGLVCWTGSECKAAKFREEEGRWEVEVAMQKGGGKEVVVVRAQQLVLATGMTGLPNVPDFKGAHLFQGVQMHSSEYKGGQEWAGKRCVVVGSNNSAHDICADLWESAVARVTMLQRSPTNILRYPAFAEVHSPLYCADSKLSTEQADLLLASIPYKLFPRTQIPLYQKFAETDKSFYDALTKVGFLHTFGEDASGVFSMYFRRGSGFYIDVGASQLVIQQEIKLKSKVSVQEITPHSLLLSDGSEEEADLIVYATGYKPMNSWAAALISQEVADKVGKCWGLGSNTTKDPGPWEREIRNMWKPTHQPNLWFHGGGFQEARHYSLYLALQLKARMEGLATPIYGLPDVHHTH